MPAVVRHSEAVAAVVVVVMKQRERHRERTAWEDMALVCVADLRITDLRLTRGPIYT